MGFSKQKNNDNCKNDLTISPANNSRSNNNVSGITKNSSRSIKWKKNDENKLLSANKKELE